MVRLLAPGKGNKQFAATLGVSSRTIQSHRSRIIHKTDFASFSDLIRYAILNHLVEAQRNSSLRPEAQIRNVSAENGQADGTLPLHDSRFAECFRMPQT